MLIILCLYVITLWAVFVKFKLLRWRWTSSTLAVLGRKSNSSNILRSVSII